MSIADSGLMIRHSFIEQEMQTDPPVAFGAVYYRRSNPPRQDWERDYRVAKEDGHTVFRHWFLWSDIHIAPDTFDFEPYDEHVRLAAKYGIKTVIAEHITCAPDWLYHQCPQGRWENAHGSRNHYEMTGSSATSSSKMCLDHPTVRAEAEKFLTALARHYKDMPGVYGYDIWNECSLYNTGNLCYSPVMHTQFQLWCKQKYGDIEAVKAAWRRNSLSCFEDIEIPRVTSPFPDVADSVYFFNDRAIAWMRFRAETLRTNDPNHYIIAHGNGKTQRDIPACDDMWRSAQEADIYGYTFWYNNKCNPFLGGDMTRMASDGKLWWRAEALGDHDWSNRHDSMKESTVQDDMHDPLNIRCDAMISLSTGSRGFINPRWRPLQDGFLQGAFGWYGMDGSRTDRSEMVKAIEQWANGDTAKPLWAANPVRGEIGLLLLEESEIYCYTLHGTTQIYNYAYQGAYDAFVDSGIQADPIRLKDLSKYDTVYVPFPYALSLTTVTRMKQWVENGGKLISEACFGYLNEHGHAYEHQPSRGLDELFGCKEASVHLGADRWKHLSFQGMTGAVRGNIFRQSYIPTTGTPLGSFDNGECAVVVNTYGKGQTCLIGSIAGYAYHTRPDENTRRFFASHLYWAGKQPYVTLPFNNGIVARVWADDKRCFIWFVNVTRHDQCVIATVNPACFSFNAVRSIRGGEALLKETTLQIDCPQRDAVVVELLLSK